MIMFLTVRLLLSVSGVSSIHCQKCSLRNSRRANVYDILTNGRVNLNIQNNTGQMGGFVEYGVSGAKGGNAVMIGDVWKFQVFMSVNSRQGSLKCTFANRKECKIFV